jgi:hypothetical protein
MTSFENEARLAKMFTTLGEGEHEIEEFRQKLAKMDDYDPYLLYIAIDSKARGSISPHDLLRFFRYYSSLM